MENENRKIITEAELIITPRGTIYHLDIAPEDLASTVITVGDPGRVEQITKHFDKIVFRAKHREFITHTGYIGRKKLSVISTGIGPDNVDIVFNELDALANIDFKSRRIKDIATKLTIIRFGTCGALQADIPLGGNIVSTHGIGLDNLMHYYKVSNTGNEISLNNDFCNHVGLIAPCRVTPYLFEGSKILNDFFDNSFFHGITVTCPGFYGPQGRVLRVPIEFPNLIESLISFKSGNNRITNFEMETSAMYGLARIMGHNSISISTAVANRASGTFTKDGNKDVENMIVKTLEVVVDKIAS